MEGNKKIKGREKATVSYAAVQLNVSPMRWDSQAVLTTAHGYSFNYTPLGQYQGHLQKQHCASTLRFPYSFGPKRNPCSFVKVMTNLENSTHYQSSRLTEGIYQIILQSLITPNAKAAMLKRHTEICMAGRQTIMLHADAFLFFVTLNFVFTLLNLHRHKRMILTQTQKLSSEY